LALKRIKTAGKEQVDETTIFRAIDEMRNIVNSATSKTHSMRRSRSRAQENSKIQQQNLKTGTNPTVKDGSDTNKKTTEAFDSIEVWK
jgi:putative transposase